MRLQLRRTAIPIVLAALGVGCGSSGSSTPAGNPLDSGREAGTSIGGADARDGRVETGAVETADAAVDGSDLPAVDASVESACAAYATAYCSRYAACDAVGFGSYYGDAGTCEARIANTYCVSELTAANVGATPRTWTDCALATTAQSCDEWLNGSAAACGVVGSIPRGSACEFSLQCQSGFCKRATGSWCGTCQTASDAGSPCDPNNNWCTSGLLCADVGCSVALDSAGNCPGVRTWRCVQPTPQGSACVTPAQCAGEWLCESGRCSAPKQLGDACQNGTTCALSSNIECLPIDGGYACSPVVFVTSGAACSPGTGVLCAAGGVCRNAAGQPSESGTCSPPAADGETCGSNPCLLPALCSGGKCRLPGDVKCQ